MKVTITPVSRTIGVQVEGASRMEIEPCLDMLEKSLIDLGVISIEGPVYTSTDTEIAYWRLQIPEDVPYKSRSAVDAEIHSTIAYVLVYRR